MSISVALADNPNNTVTVQVTSTGTTVTIYRAVGGSPATAVASSLALTGGAATYVDTPPQKTLLSYYAVNDASEASTIATTVLPINYSLGRPCLNGDIVLGDMVFNTIDSDGTVWTVSDIDGWWTLPDASVPTALRAPYEDGDYDDSGRYETRVMKFEGAFLPASRDMLETARARLVSTLNLVRRTAQLKVYETIPKFMDVRVTGSTLIDTSRPSGLTFFSTSLRASYPVKRSISPIAATLVPSDTIAGRTYSRTYPRTYPAASGTRTATVNNVGNYPTYPVVTINGAAVNPRVENSTTGEFIELSITLGPSDYLTIDMREKSVILNGQASRRGALTLASTWWQLQPGGNTIKYVPYTFNTGSTATIVAQSAWIG